MTPRARQKISPVEAMVGVDADDKPERRRLMSWRAECRDNAEGGMVEKPRDNAEGGMVEKPRDNAEGGMVEKPR